MTAITKGTEVVALEDRFKALINRLQYTDNRFSEHGYDTDMPTYKRGPRRLDYMFISRRLIYHIKRGGYEKFDTKIVSDHCGYYVDFSLTGLFD